MEIKSTHAEDRKTVQTLAQKTCCRTGYNLQRTTAFERNEIAPMN